MAEGFYVTVMKEDLVDRPRMARGPFPTHEEALALVEETRQRAERADPWSVFYRWGTTKLTAPELPEAPMNKLWTREGF